MIKVDKDNIKCVVFDLDGTIYFGNKQLGERANDVIEYTRKKYGRVFFATNNSALTQNQVYNRLVNLGIDLKEDEVINSSYLISKYLEQNNIKDVWCIGTDDFKGELIKHKINPSSNKPKAIVIGYNYNFQLSHIEDALRYYNDDCRIIVANKERTYPRDGGIVTPGAGAIVSAFLHTVNRQEDIVLGKPSALMLATIANKEHLLPYNILMIGDTYESDIKMAQTFGSQSVLITNGKNIAYNCNQVNYIKDLLEEL